MRFVALLLVAIVCLSLVACVTFSPEQAERLNVMQQKIEAIYTESQEVAAQIQRINKRQAEVREQLKNGEIDAVGAAALLVELADEAEEAYKHYDKLKADAVILYNQYIELKESGVPWYQTVGYILWSLVTAYLGKKVLGQSAGITLVTRSVENGSIRNVNPERLKAMKPEEIACLMKKDIKNRINNGRNAEVEKAVLKLPS